MEIDHTVMKRLAFIKYLYQTSISQSYAPSPLCCAAILTMHDAVELFLQLASEHRNANVGPKPGFMDYWEPLNKTIAHNGLQQQESMRRLNKARVALKHHGTFPSQWDIESFRVSISNFFATSTPLIFSIDFDEISLVDFVNPEAAREKLKSAQNQIEAGDILNALDNIALAFSEIISDYEDRKRDEFYFSPFEFGKNMKFLNSFHMGFRGGIHSSEESKFIEFIDKVKESIEAMQEALKMLALKIDYRKYSRFKMLTPTITPLLQGEPYIHRRFGDHDKPSAKDAYFCLDFAIESSLILSEFDYTNDEHK